MESNDYIPDLNHSIQRPTRVGLEYFTRTRTRTHVLKWPLLELGEAQKVLEYVLADHCMADMASRNRNRWRMGMAWLCIPNKCDVFFRAFQYYSSRSDDGSGLTFLYARVTPYWPSKTCFRLLKKHQCMALPSTCPLNLFLTTARCASSHLTSPSQELPFFILLPSQSILSTMPSTDTPPDHNLQSPWHHVLCHQILIICSLFPRR